MSLPRSLNHCDFACLLQLQEAKEAFDSGGGGKRAQMARILAEAKLKAAGGPAAAAAGGATGTEAGAAGGQAHDRQGSGAAAAAAAGPAAAAAAAGGGDWRLRAPDRSQDMPKFKPGAVTWDTDDYVKPAAAGGGAGGKKSSAAGAKPQAAAAPPSSSDANGGKPSPAEWYERAGHVKYIDSATTTGAASRSFTSTAWAPQTRNALSRTRLERKPSKKGYLRLHTSMGDLNLELHCDLAPRTCENFLALADMGYYNGTVFHRSIKNFMIQVHKRAAVGHQAKGALRGHRSPRHADDGSTALRKFSVRLQIPGIGKVALVPS